MSTRDSLTLLRGVHTHAHMYTQSCDDIGLQKSPSWPKEHTTSSCPSSEVSLGPGTGVRVLAPPPPAQTPSAPNL